MRDTAPVKYGLEACTVVVCFCVFLASLCSAVQAQRLNEPQGTGALSDKEAPLKGPIGGLGLPEGHAVMTPDLLLVNPGSKVGQAPNRTSPLKAHLGMSLRIVVTRHEVRLQKLHGLPVTVVNDTAHPLVINGDQARAIIGQRSYNSAPVTALELAISPAHGKGRAAVDLVGVVTPAAVTIGVEPTIRDLVTVRKPVLDRYGKDEERRDAEASRFGKRIVWPHEKTEGIVYFQTGDDLSGATVEMPVSALFDEHDVGLLVSSP